MKIKKEEACTPSFFIPVTNVSAWLCYIEDNRLPFSEKIRIHDYDTIYVISLRYKFTISLRYKITISLRYDTRRGWFIRYETRMV